MGHPTFYIMLYSHKRRTALQGQGRVDMHTNDIDTTITAEEFLNEWDNGDLQCKLKRRLKHFSGNASGTNHYWKSTIWEFKAITLFNNYMNMDLISFFHTLNTTEYHDPYICLFMAKYVMKINDGNEDLYDCVLSEDNFLSGMCPKVQECSV